MYAEFVTCYEATGQNGLRNLFPDEWSTTLKSHLRYTVIMSQQYNAPITTRRVMLSSTSILSIMLLRRKSKSIPLVLST
jgi:hypothetical protein